MYRFKCYGACAGIKTFRSDEEEPDKCPMCNYPGSYVERRPQCGLDSHCLPLCTTSMVPIATDFIRVVRGDRGAYVEFYPEQIIAENLHMPEDAKWRIKSKNAYYVEYRTNADNVKIYYQRKLVDYADYKLKLIYIALGDLYTDSGLALTHYCPRSGFPSSWSQEVLHEMELARIREGETHER